MGALRALLAISVLITHSTPIFGVRLLSGDAAITCFFVISGFLMALILTEKYSDKRTFYVNRLLRIYPAYYVALALSVALFLVASNSKHDPITTLNRAIEAESWLWVAWSTISNATLAGIDLTRYISVDGGYAITVGGVGHGGHNLLFVPQAWTLALELQFYAVAPWLVRWRSQSLAALVVGLIAARWYALTQAAAAGNPFDPSAVIVFNLQYFVMGMLGYRVYARVRTAGIDALSSLGALCAICLVVVVLHASGALRPYTDLKLNVLYAAFAAAVPFVFHISRSWRLDSAAGEYSYPIYVFHYMVVCGVISVAPGALSGITVLGITLAISASYIYLIDRPLQRYRAAYARINQYPAKPAQLSSVTAHPARHAHVSPAATAGQ